MRLKELRKNFNKTQKQVADAINIKVQAYQTYELELKRPSFETLFKLADYFGTSIDYILGYNSPYIMDISTLTKSQLEMIERIKNCSERDCLLLNAYLDGLKKN